jgi:intracellular sulfur oxidation DsrE/DsrF family protein
MQMMVNVQIESQTLKRKKMTWIILTAGAAVIAAIIAVLWRAKSEGYFG